MKCFEHNGNKCISINGKDYFLLRGYKVEHDKFVFVQVAGNTPLHKEDLPTKDWEIIQTKTAGRKVWTAYRKAYFRYDSEDNHMELAFVGMTSHGSYFLALRWMARKCHIQISDEALNEKAIELAGLEDYKPGLKRCKDEGSTGEDAITIDWGVMTDEDDVIRLLKGCDT